LIVAENEFSPDTRSVSAILRNSKHQLEVPMLEMILGFSMISISSKAIVFGWCLLVIAVCLGCLYENHKIRKNRDQKLVKLPQPAPDITTITIRPNSTHSGDLVYRQD
jgi:hypothetical protein